MILRNQGNGWMGFTLSFVMRTATYDYYPHQRWSFFFVFAFLFFFLLNFDDAAQVLRTLGFAGGA
jgi:hypothetical protein